MLERKALSAMKVPSVLASTQPGCSFSRAHPVPFADTQGERVAKKRSGGGLRDSRRMKKTTLPGGVIPLSGKLASAATDSGPLFEGLSLGEILSSVAAKAQEVSSPLLA